MQPLGVGGVDVRDFEVKNCYESSGRDWSARSAPIGGERVCRKRMIPLLSNKLLALHRDILKSFIELQIDENLSNRRERKTRNVALFSYTRTFGDGPRNFEP
ncbi:hypothetical protein TNCV_615891 [Trichonephila clavipes]|nr:hypothetical protein TNCV_615891 [Trichonephila clavipes]